MTTDVFPVPEAMASSAHADEAKYNEMYAASVNDPEAFWGEHGKRLDWMTPYTKVKNTSYDYHNVSIKWFEDGELNVCANCVDRHVASRGDQTAILWEADDPALNDRVTYAQLYDRVRRFANMLKKLGVSKGDRVILYMPMIPEAAYAMLACARIGAVHSIVFGGFSPDALADRVNDCGAKLVVTADEGLRQGLEARPVNGVRCRFEDETRFTKLAHVLRCLLSQLRQLRQGLQGRRTTARAVPNQWKGGPR